MALLYAACIVFAAGLGNHLTIVGLLPAALIYGIAKDRSVLRPRVLGICALIGAIGVAQYGFIALRTVQGAPYLEARATTIRGIYDVIIARDVSWARFYQAADKVVGIEVPMLLEGLRVHMGTVTVILVVIGIAIAAWRRNWEALLVAGGAAGTLAHDREPVGRRRRLHHAGDRAAVDAGRVRTRSNRAGDPPGRPRGQCASPRMALLLPVVESLRHLSEAGACARSGRRPRLACALSAACRPTAPSLRTTTSSRASSTTCTIPTNTIRIRIRGCSTTMPARVRAAAAEGRPVFALDAGGPLADVAGTACSSRPDFRGSHSTMDGGATARHDGR